MPFIIPKQLENVPQDVRDQFKGDSFICTECGGMLIPFTMKRGVCFQCGTEENLNDADWESNDDDERTINSASQEDTMTQTTGFDIDVPVTLTVTVRGTNLTEEQAKKIARDFANHIAPSESEPMYFNAKTHTVEITDHAVVSFGYESSEEDECEVLETLDAD